MSRSVAIMILCGLLIILTMIVTLLAFVAFFSGSRLGFFLVLGVATGIFLVAVIVILKNGTPEGEADD